MTFSCTHKTICQRVLCRNANKFVKNHELKMDFTSVNGFYNLNIYQPENG